MGVLSGYKPEGALYFFEEISKIPRGSGNEKQVAEYCKAFGEERGLESVVDEWFNVLIKKPGTKGKESLEPVILQGHLDIVCEKNAGVEHDFLKDPIKLVVKDDFIHADGTTLGADNGAAIAIMLAILDDKNISHPPLECLFTSQEETGLVGAAKFDASLLKGKNLINLDSEEYGEVKVSCAGGMHTDTELKINRVDSSENSDTYAIRVRGLKGGHSGSDIILERANANKLLGRTLDFLNGKINYEICSISGGLKDNAIPREAQSYINIDQGDAEKLENLLAQFEAVILNEFKLQENNITIRAAKEEKQSKVFCKETKSKAIDIIMAIPNGIQAMSHAIEGLVETSNNLGVIKTNDDCVIFSCALRSSVTSRKEMVEATIKNIASLAGAKFSSKSNYPGWEYNPNSELKKRAVKIFKDLTGGVLESKAVHAGVECGLFCEKIPGIDIISLGPDMSGVHTPDEKMSISSFAKTYDFMLKLLESF